MAHVGSLYPLLVPSWEFWIFDEGYGSWFQGIPRCWQMITSGTPSGTLAMKWLDLTVVSQPYEVAEDRQSITWKIEHPDDPAAYFEIELKWEQWLFVEPFAAQPFRYLVRLRYFDTPGLLANVLLTNQAFPDQFRNLTGSTIFQNLFGNLGVPVDPAAFSHVGHPTRWRSATWEQQEEDYHPYRYGP